jgi:hypothetical protein
LDHHLNVLETDEESLGFFRLNARLLSSLLLLAHHLACDQMGGFLCQFVSALSLSVGLVGLCSFFDEVLDYEQVAVLCCDMQWCISKALSLLVHILANSELVSDQI